MVSSANIEERSQQILELLSTNDLDEAIKRFLDFTKDFNKSDNYAQKVGITSSRAYHNWKRDKQSNILSPNEEARRINKIVQDIIDQVHTLKEEYLKQATTSSFLVSLDNQPVLDSQEVTILKDASSFEVDQQVKQVAFKGDKLEKAYTSFLLRDVSISLRLGEIVSLVGKNASGKTTLLNLISGTKKANRGQMSYPALCSNKKLDWLQVKHQMSYLPQMLTNWNQVNLKRFLSYQAATKGITGSKNEEAVEWIIQRMGLQDHIHKKWASLSTGYKWRFEIARSLVWNPKLLLLDEPLANLDIIAQEAILEDLRNLATSPRNPIAILISSQHLTEVDRVTDYTIYLVDGKVEYYGKTEDIGKQKHHKTFELISDISREKLAQALSVLNIKVAPKYRDKHLLKTISTIQTLDIMKALVQANINITGLTDISNTSKTWFYEAD